MAVAKALFTAEGGRLRRTKYGLQKLEEEWVRMVEGVIETLRPGDDINTAGVKFDNGKTRDDLLPPEVEEAIATVLEFGAKKYAERNWEQGMLWSRPYAAARRHLRNWFARRDFGKGPGNDKDSGFSDLWHAATNVAFLIAYEIRGKGTDDRPIGAVNRPAAA